MKSPILAFLRAFLLLVSLNLTEAGEISGLIVSCGGWSLGRLPSVKQFIKLNVDEGAESYHNVKIEFVSGKKPILTIYDDGVETEQVALAEYDGSVEALHALFQEKGFIQKPKNEDGDYEDDIEDTEDKEAVEDVEDEDDEDDDDDTKDWGDDDDDDEFDDDDDDAFDDDEFEDDGSYDYDDDDDYDYDDVFEDAHDEF